MNNSIRITINARKKNAARPPAACGVYDVRKDKHVYSWRDHKGFWARRLLDYVLTFHPESDFVTGATASSTPRESLLRALLQTVLAEEEDESSDATGW